MTGYRSSCGVAVVAAALCVLVFGCSHDFEQFRYLGGAGGTGGTAHNGGGGSGTGGDGTAGDGLGGLGGAGGTAEPGDLLWSLRFGSAEDDDVNGMALDGDGNIYLTGFFAGSADFLGQQHPSAGGNDAYLAKLDVAGNAVWIKLFADSDDQVGTVVRVAGDRVVVAGWFSGTIGFDGYTHDSAGGIDGFVAAFYRDGSHLWSTTFSGPDRQAIYDVGLSTDGSTTYAIGTAETSVTIGGGVAQNVQGMEDVVVARFDGSGLLQASDVFGDQFNQVGRCIVPTADGVIVAGSFGVSMPMGCTTTPASTGSGDTFVAGLTDDLGCQWIFSYGTPDGYQEPDELVPVEATQLVLIGRYADGIDFGSNPLTAVGGFDIYRAAFTPTGEVAASFSYGGNLNDRAFGLAAGAGGQLALTGYHAGGIDFGSGTAFDASDQDLFVAKLTGTNQHVWSRSFSASGVQRGKAVQLDDQGAVIATGTFEVSLDLGGGELPSDGLRDIFVARFAP